MKVLSFYLGVRRVGNEGFSYEGFLILFLFGVGFSFFKEGDYFFYLG